MAYGCFVDIRQQCGRLIRMHYPIEQIHIVKWIGINEQMADKYNQDACGDHNASQ